MRQTAVEWLTKKMIISLGQEYKFVLGFFEIAKEMEKQQMIEMYREEEVLDILFSMSVDNPNDITEWFEQFKNK